MRKSYSINLDPIIIEALDAYILREKKRVFKKEGDYAYALRCWSRYFFIEEAIKKLDDTIFKFTPTLRKSYLIKLDTKVVIALDLKILEEKCCVLKKEKLDVYLLRCCRRNLFIEQAIKQLIERKKEKVNA